MGQIGPVYPPPVLRAGVSEPVDKDEKRGKPLFVESGRKERQGIFKAEVLITAGDQAGGRDHDPQKDIAFSILARTGLKEPLEELCFRSTAVFSEVLTYSS